MKIHLKPVLTSIIAALMIATGPAFPDEKPLNTLANSSSPTGDYSLVWRAPTDENWPMAELFLSKGDDKTTLAPLATALPWITNDQLENHVSTIVSWAGKDAEPKGFVLAVNRKWETATLHFYARDGEAYVLNSDLLVPFSEAVLGKLYGQNTEADFSGYTLTVGPAPQIGLNEFKKADDPSVILLTAIMQQPKASTPVYEFEIEIKVHNYRNWWRTEVSRVVLLPTN